METSPGRRVRHFGLECRVMSTSSDAAATAGPTAPRAWILVAWVAVLGADRIDLLGGNGPFQLIPLHLLTAVAIASEWWRRLATRTLPTVTRAQAVYGAIVLGLLALVAASVVRSVDIGISTNRALLLTGTAVGTSLAVWGASDRTDLSAVLARGGRAGLLLALVFSGAQLLEFLSLAPEWFRLGPVRVTISSHSYGIFPRLSGASGEMNGAGAALLVQSALIALGTPPLRARRGWILLGGVLIVSTLSRSSALAAVVALALFPRVVRARAAARIALAAALGCVALGSALLLGTGVRDTTARALAPLAGRFDPSEGSAQAHAMLLERGLSEATMSVPRTLLGVGYGASYRVLADIFPGTKYGNFHTLYLQLWVEAGLAALLALALLFALTLPRAGALTGVVAGMMLYNVFYEGLMQPALWLVLALIWLAPLVARPSRGAWRPWYATA